MFFDPDKSKNELISLIEKLVSYDTSENKTDNILACFNFIDDQIRPFGFVPHDYLNNGVKSRVWSLGPKENLTPDILYSAHLDVVPGVESQFKVQQIDRKLYGRGVSDMKFAIASFIQVITRLNQESTIPPSIVLMITSDEEQGGLDGTNYLVNQIGYRPSVVLMPDGGDEMSLTYQSKGVLQVKATAHGQSAHGAYLWQGVNAIDKLVAFLSTLRMHYPAPRTEVWENTANIGVISGGRQTNQVPDLAEAKIDFRLIPGTDPKIVLEKLKAIGPELDFTVLVDAVAFATDINHAAIKLWTDTLSSVTGQPIKMLQEHGASDARFFTPFGIPVILSKPISGGDHSPNEWIDVDSLMAFNEALYKYLKNFV